MGGVTHKNFNAIDMIQKYLTHKETGKYDPSRVGGRETMFRKPNSALDLFCMAWYLRMVLTILRIC